MSHGRSAAARRWQMVRSGGTAGRFEARARRRRLRALLPLFVVVVVVTVLLLAGWLVLGTRVFDVRTVTVTGAVTVRQATVREAAAVRLGSSLARVDVDGVRDRVSALGPIAKVQVYRTWPHTLTVQITERQPVAVVHRRGGYAELDAAGVPFRTVARRPAGLPLVVLVRPGPRDRATRSVLVVAAALTPELRDRLARIAAPTAEQVTVVLTDKRQIFWGDSDHSDRKATVATALLARPGQRIDVSAPRVVTVK